MTGHDGGPGLGSRLRNARRSVGLTQLELARVSGASERAIRNIEQGSVQARSGTLDVVVAALAAHGVDPAGLLGAPDAAVGSGVPVPAHLPAALGGFVGRDAELTLARALLTSPQRDHPPVVLISGAPGVGKTTLAVQATQSVRADFPDGQLYVSLRGGSGRRPEPATVLAGFLRAFGIESPPSAVEEQERLFRSFTADRAVLVVLDDVPDGFSVRPLLPGGKACATVVTSRARLPDLDGVHRLDLDRLSPDEAVDLLAAVAGQDRIGADTRSAARIAELCGHLPLAVRIAGALLAVRPHWAPARLAARLEDDRTRLDVLSAGDRAIRATLTEACAALPAGTREAFVLLASLPVPDFAPWLAESVLGRTADDVEDVLDALFDAHLVSVTVGARGRERYRFHDLTRAFAVAQDGSGLGAERAVAAALAAAEQVDGVLQHRFVRGDRRSARQVVRLPEDALRAPQLWFDDEKATLLDLLRHAGRTPGLETGCWQLSASLDGYLEMRGDLADWRAAQDVALDAVRRSGDPVGEAAVLRARGELCFDLDEIAEGLVHLQRSLELIAGRDDRLSEAHLVRAVAYGRLQLGELDVAAQGYASALDVFVELGDRAGQADAASGLGTIELHNNRPAEARRNLAIALRAYRDLDERLSYASMSLTAGTLEAREQRFETARRHFLESLATSRAVGHEPLIAGGMLSLGELYRRQGRTGRAGTLLRSACARAERSGDRSTLCSALHYQALLHRDLGAHDAALADLEHARTIANDIRSPLLVGTAHDEIGNTLRACGDDEGARKAWREALGAFGTASPARADAVSRKLQDLDEAGT